MFNGYIAEKRLQKARKTEQIQRRESEIRKRYHTEVQPLLLEHYQKRLRSFIQKMNSHPIIVNPQNLLPPIKELPHFTFRDASDWKNIGNQYHQQQTKTRDRLDSNKQQVEKHHTLNSDTYTVYKHEFRSRQRQKQVQPAMRFKSVEKCREIRKKNLSTQQARKKQPKQSKNRRESFTGLRETTISISNNSSNKILDQEELEFLLNRQKNDIELEARLYEKQRQPDQKKLHFKKIADLALTEKDEYQKKDLREILRKSGYSRVKRVNFTEVPETDNFSVLVQKISAK